MKKQLYIIPFIVFCLTLGFWAGNNFSGNDSSRHSYMNAENREIRIEPGANKLDEILAYIEACYVDNIGIDSLIEKSIPKIISELDPHSSYIPRDEVEQTNSELEGSFSGIGIRFSIQDDTINIGEVIRGGPSEKVGLLDGDKIVTINDTLFVGKDVCNNNDAMKKLKGPKGSTVKLGILRYGEKDLLEFVIERDDIAVESIEAAYMIDDKWGYIMVEKFADNTYVEFFYKAMLLTNQNAKGLIIDLRGNGGGYMGVAIEMANQFLDDGDMIVYTEGEKSEKMEEYANGRGLFKDMPLVVLVDESSASASEIIAGTIQDNDRGTIIGRRTFGKGLVQQSIELSDGSAMRLTISRYHTPSGRCIQKPYVKGDKAQYDMDLLDRFNRGEFFNADSIHLNKELVYKTKKGRTVYGGGGIMPDIFVASDTANISDYVQSAVSRGLVSQFALRYANSNRMRLSGANGHEELVSLLDKSNVVEEFVKFTKGKGLEPDNTTVGESFDFMKRTLYSNIIYQLQGMLEHVKFINKEDKTVLKAIEVLEKGEAFP